MADVNGNPVDLAIRPGEEFEEYPVTDLDVGFPYGNMQPFTLVEGRDDLAIYDERIVINFGIGHERTVKEELTILLAPGMWYSVRNRMHRRKLKGPNPDEIEPPFNTQAL